MPQERDNQYPHLTPAQFKELTSGTPRDTLAARVLMSRNITGIPRRPYLVGENDSAPMLKGIAEFAEKVYALMDALDALDDIEGGMPASVEDAASEIISFMEEPIL